MVLRPSQVLLASALLIAQSKYLHACRGIGCTVQQGAPNVPRALYFAFLALSISQIYTYLHMILYIPFKLEIGKELNFEKKDISARPSPSY